MKIRYELQTPWPEGLENPHDFGAMDWYMSGEIPFVPTIGMEIENGCGDLHTVKQVIWTAAEPNQITVFFDGCEEPIKRYADYYIRNGWKTNDVRLPATAKKSKPNRAGA